MSVVAATVVANASRRHAIDSYDAPTAQPQVVSVHEPGSVVVVVVAPGAIVEVVVVAQGSVVDVVDATVVLVVVEAGAAVVEVVVVADGAVVDVVVVAAGSVVEVVVVDAGPVVDVVVVPAGAVVDVVLKGGRVTVGGSWAEPRAARTPPAASTSSTATPTVRSRAIQRSGSPPNPHLLPSLVRTRGTNSSFRCAPVDQLAYFAHSRLRRRAMRSSVGGCERNRFENCAFRPVSGLMMYAVAWAGSTFIGTWLA